MGKKNMNKPVHMEPTHIDHLEKPPAVRNSKEMHFESLDDFERYIMDESWDNEFDNLNIHVKYLPPFIVNQTRGNEDKIKPQMNSLNKKFRRHLQHHVKRHLLPDITKMSGIDYNFTKDGEESVSNQYGTSSVHRWHLRITQITDLMRLSIRIESIGKLKLMLNPTQTIHGSMSHIGLSVTVAICQRMMS